MEFRVLRYFLAVAKEESITAAAEYLHISQPTLSRQLMDLEEELEKTLFIRSNRKITLTEDGILLRKRASEIMSLMHKTEEELKHSNKTISGDVYIGCGETEAMRIIASISKKLHNLYPNIRYHIFSGNAEEVTERLDKGLIDFGVVIEPTDIRKYNYEEIPYADTWGVLMRKDSPLAVKEYISPDELVSIPLIMSQQALESNELSLWIGKDYESLDIVATYNLLFNASLLVEEGLGYALCLDKLINITDNNKLCFIPLKPNLQSKLNIIWKNNQILSSASNMFLMKVKEDLLIRRNNKNS